MAMSNDTNFGLMAGVVTYDISKVLGVPSEFKSGMVGVNCMSLMFSQRRLVEVKRAVWEENVASVQ